MRGKPPAQILERCGWSRSVGGAGPYLTLFSRGGASRETTDKAASTLAIHELPTLGVTEKEVDKLCDAVVKALEQGALDPDGIREATGKASRSLGEEGKKRGLTTTLPLALGRLQTEGRIRRVPVNGRLDQQRYAYVNWTPNPLATYPESLETAFTELARRLFRWIGPATLGEFQWFAGLGVKATKQAVDSLGLVPAEPGSDRLLLADDVAAFRALEAPTTPQYTLVSSLDPITANRREMQSLIDDDDRQRTVMVDAASKPVGGGH
jgi:DNA glycosylase AlkZ-like